jgi:hypothetical protein
MASPDPDQIIERFSANLRYHLQLSGLTQERAAIRAGLHRTEIGKLIHHDHPLCCRGRYRACPTAQRDALSGRQVDRCRGRVSNDPRWGWLSKEAGCRLALDDQRTARKH